MTEKQSEGGFQASEEQYRPLERILSHIFDPSLVIASPYDFTLCFKRFGTLLYDDKKLPYNPERKI